MATRNLTAIFLDLRRKRPGSTRLAPEHTRAVDSLDEQSLHLTLSVSEGTPPAWVETVESVREIDATIQEQLTVLRELQNQHLKPRFGKDEEAEEREIQLKTDEVKQLFRQGDVLIRRLIAKEGDLRQRPPDEQKLLNNVQVLCTQASVVGFGAGAVGCAWCACCGVRP